MKGDCTKRELMEIMPNFKDGETYLRFKCYEYECEERHGCNKFMVKDSKNT